MTDTTTITIPHDLVDDLDVSREDTYTDPTSPLPIAAGIYPVRLTKTRFRTVSKLDPEVFYADGKFPEIDIQEAVIVNPDGAFDGRTIYYPGSIRTKPQDLFRGGVTTRVNDLADAIGSADATLRYRGLQEGLELFRSLTADPSTTFRMKVDWVAEDYKGANETIRNMAAARGLAVKEFQERERKLYNEIKYERYVRKGMGTFKNPSTGAFETTFDFAAVNSGVGNTVEVRTKLVGWVASTDRQAKNGPVRVYLQSLEQAKQLRAHAAATAS